MKIELFYKVFQPKENILFLSCGTHSSSKPKSKEIQVALKMSEILVIACMQCGAIGFPVSIGFPGLVGAFAD